MTKYMVNYNILYCNVENKDELSCILPMTFHKIMEIEEPLTFGIMEQIQQELIKEHDKEGSINCPMIQSLYAI